MSRTAKISLMAKIEIKAVTAFISHKQFWLKSKIISAKDAPMSPETILFVNFIMHLRNVCYALSIP